ncbi:MAG TPA: hypothetical protein VLW85_10600 [Myxococcales bacterium]|nr:hypothetical protein [Myxococcales bacterium]
MALTVGVALALVVLLRTPGVLAPALAWEVGTGRPGEPDEGDEQLPETDRAPRRWLPWTVAAVAALRVLLLVTLHA